MCPEKALEGILNRHDFSLSLVFLRPIGLSRCCLQQGHEPFGIVFQVIFMIYGWTITLKPNGAAVSQIKFHIDSAQVTGTKIKNLSADTRWSRTPT